MKKIEYLLGRLIAGTWRGMRKQMEYNIAQTEHDITAVQGMILAMLSHYDNVNQQMLTEFIHCEKTAITRWVDHLESMKLVKRVPGKIDRRQNILKLTQRGHKYASDFIDIGLLTEKQALKGIDNEKAEICKEVLKQIIINLETI